MVTFTQLVANPSLGLNFNPDADRLDLEVNAAEVRVILGADFTSFQIVINGVLETGTIDVAATSLAWGFGFSNLTTSSGVLGIGDVNRALGDAGADNVKGQLDFGNQYHGLSGADTFMGGIVGDLVYGNKHNDIILGGGGTDTLYGGQGDDWIQGWDVSDSIGGHDNTLTGAGGGAAIDAGNQLIYGNLGGDTQISGSGDDIHYGGQGSDLIYAFGGSDVTYGNKGDDTIYGGSGADLIYGGQGADSIIATNDGLANVIYGNLDNDRISTSTGADTVYGGQGVDVIIVNSGSNSGQLIRGNKGDDFIAGADGQGNDTLEGNAGADTITGGTFSGNVDILDGGTGDDYLRAGADLINGFSSTMIGLGGDGDDTVDARLNLSAGGSSLDGGSGNDVIYGGVQGDTIRGGSGDDTIYAGGASFAEEVYAGAGNDVVYLGESGTATNSLIKGGAGDDLIQSDAGSHTIDAGLGQDTVVAGWGGSDTILLGADFDADMVRWDSAGALAAGSTTQTGVSHKGAYLTGMNGSGTGASGGQYARRLPNYDAWSITAYSAFNKMASQGSGVPTQFSGTGNVKLAITQKGVGNDVVSNFSAGVDQLAFNIAGIFGNQKTTSKFIIKGLNSAAPGVLVQSKYAQTVNSGFQISDVLLAGNYASKAALSAAIVSNMKTDGALTLYNGGAQVTFYGFAGNTANTMLWIFSAVQSAAGAGNEAIDAGAVLYTINVSATLGLGDILLV